MDFSLRRAFWFRNRQSAWPFRRILVFASTFLTRLSVLLSTSLSSCRGLSLLLFSVILVKLNFSDLWLIFFRGAEGTSTTEWERPSPKRLWGKGGLYLLRVMDVRTENRGGPHQKVRFPAAPVVGRNFIIPGHAGVRVRNVREKSEPPKICLCCFFFPETCVRKNNQQKLSYIINTLFLQNWGFYEFMFFGTDRISLRQMFFKPHEWPF